MRALLSMGSTRSLGAGQSLNQVVHDSSGVRDQLNSAVSLKTAWTKFEVQSLSLSFRSELDLPAQGLYFTCTLQQRGRNASVNCSLKRQGAMVLYTSLSSSMDENNYQPECMMKKQNICREIQRHNVDEGQGREGHECFVAKKRAREPINVMWG